MVSADHQRSGFFCALRRKGSTGFAQFKVQCSRLKATSYFLHQTSSFRHQTSYFLHHPSYFFSNIPRPLQRYFWFKVQGSRFKVQPPLSCILPPQGEENRSACRSYIKVSADHQRSKGLSPVQSSKFKVQRSKVEGRARPQQVLGSLRELLMIIFTPQKIPQTEER